VVKDNHTTCACNTAFVFFKDTCTATDSVYLNLTGVLKLRQGGFTDSELKQILVDGFSAYLNYSKEFIMIIINREDVLVTNGTSNSTYRRRLLSDWPVEFNYTALMRLQKDDKETYKKIKEISAEALNQTISITDATGNQINVGAAALQDNYLRNDGKPVDECPKGGKRAINKLLQDLSCEYSKPDEHEMKATIGGSVGGGVFVLACLGFCIWRCCLRQKAKKKKPEQAKTQETRPLMTSPNLMFQSQHRQHMTKPLMTPAKLQVPATVSFEYHLLPGQSI